QRHVAQVGAREGLCEAGYSLLERQWLRPTLDLNGLGGGYQGPGTKTVIPSLARAKVTCRLVPDQEPHEIAALGADHLRRHCPPGVPVRLAPFRHGRP